MQVCQLGQQPSLPPPSTHAASPHCTPPHSCGIQVPRRHTSSMQVEHCSVAVPRRAKGGRAGESGLRTAHARIPSLGHITHNNNAVYVGGGRLAGKHISDGGRWTTPVSSSRRAFSCIQSSHGPQRRFLSSSDAATAPPPSHAPFGCLIKSLFAASLVYAEGLPFECLECWLL